MVSWSLIAINVALFCYELTLSPERLEQLFHIFGIVPARYSHSGWALPLGLSIGDYLPFLTSMFLHGSWAQLIGNMWALWLFGDGLEDRMGGFRFLLFYLATGEIAALTDWLTNSESTVPNVGASGAIAGVLGGYFFLFPHSRVIAMVPIFFRPYFFELPAVAYLLFWLISQMVGETFAGLRSSDVGGMAFWAHVGGFTAGAVLHRLFLLPRRKAPRRFQRDEYGIEAAWTL
jgi:membrane associated rhomboid family serine protease